MKVICHCLQGLISLSCLITTLPALAQEAPHSLQTDVFVLNTSQPNNGSLYRPVRTKDTIRKIYLRKLQMKSRNLSAFKIEEINPLRYYYFINNQLVTQFMDATPTLFGQSVTNQGNSLTPTNISFLRLFDKTNSSSTSASDTLTKLDKEIDSLKNTIPDLQSKYSTAWNNYESTLEKIDLAALQKQNVSFVFLRDSIQKQDSVYIYGDKLTARDMQVQKKIDDYVNLVNQKVAYIKSNSIVDVFNNYKGYSKSIDSGIHELAGIESAIGSFPDTFYRIIANRDAVTEILDHLVTDSMYNPSLRTARYNSAQSSTKQNYEQIEKNINNLLTPLRDDFGITFDKAKLLGSESSYSNLPARLNESIDALSEAFRIKKAIAGYIFNYCEQFILRTTLDVGKLLQVQVFELSRFKNRIQNQNYIDFNTLKQVTGYTDRTKNTFEFIQKISTDLAVYATAIQANGKSYQAYLNNIDSNYVAILDYLKILDFINGNNSVEYTLPTSSNLANADFVRYSISRVDKNTLASEDLTYDIWFKGGLKIDFSAGFFASGLVDNQYQKLFISHDAASNTDSIQVHRVNDGGYSFGFGGMVNLALRTGGSWIAPGISLGFIYSNNQKLQIIGGAALHLGKTERLIAHFGIAAGTVKTFDDSQLQYSSNTISKGNNWGFRISDYSNYSIPTLVDRFTVRPFFGISYNLSKSSPFNVLSEQGQTKYNSLLLNSSNSGSTAPVVAPK